MAKNDCLNCGNEFNYYPSKSIGKYCSRSCNDEYKRRNAYSRATYLRRAHAGVVEYVPLSHKGRQFGGKAISS